MIYGLLICAGKQSRFKSDIPKALVTINDECLLDINIRNMSKYCDRVIVVCSFENESYFNNYNHIAIDSGKGSGDAIYKALKYLNLYKEDECFIQWGDSVQLDSSIYEKVLKYKSKKVIIPCVLEDKPYVQLIPNNISINVLFTKYGDDTSKGYHDLSLFFGNCEYILKYAQYFFDKYYDDCKYSHKHGNEFEFLDIFNDTPIESVILNISEFNYKSFSFNSLEDLEILKGAYNSV